jgi:hypothetical protein
MNSMVTAICDNGLEQGIEDTFFEDPNRQRYDEAWRAERANKHRPSACGGLGKALAKLRRPSAASEGYSNSKMFIHSQQGRVPVIQDEGWGDVELSDPIETSRLYSAEMVDDYEISLVVGDTGEIKYASF